MLPLVIVGLGVAGLIGYVMLSGAHAAPGLPAVRDVKVIVGKSKRTWHIERVKDVGGETFIDVFFGEPGKGGKRILRYAQTGSDTNSRRVVTMPAHSDVSASTLTSLRNDAKKDFITG